MCSFWLSARWKITSGRCGRGWRNGALFWTVAKKVRVVSAQLVIHGRGVNIGDLLVKTAFTGADLTDFRSRLSKYSCVKNAPFFRRSLSST